MGYVVYGPDEGVAIFMGGRTFNSGFVIYDDYSLFGEGDSYALFDLRGEYSSIYFDVGRTNECEIQDVTLQVFLDDVLTEKHDVNWQNPPVHLDIPLNYAGSLKLQIVGGTRVKYGFVNTYLHY